MYPNDAHWPAEGIDIPATSIGAALVTAAERWPDRVALAEGTLDVRARKWTFEELRRDSEIVAHNLLRYFEPGSRVALWSGNSPEWVLTQFGAALAGLTLVTVNPAYGKEELRYVLEQCQASGLIVEPATDKRDNTSVARTVATTLPHLGVVLEADEPTLLQERSATTTLPAVDPRDSAQIQYTSGTTGFAKGAQLAHRGLALNGLLFAQAIAARTGDVWVNPMPLFHTAGCGLVTLGALQTGGTQVLPPRFDADMVLDLIERHRGTVLLSVPTMLIRMLEAQSLRPRDVSSWRSANLGGAPVPLELVSRAEAVFNVTVGIGFGQTESSPYITHTRPDDDNADWASSVGRALPGVEVKIVNPDDGTVVALDTPGEICTRSECLMIGYFRNPAATAEAVDEDGWLHTGDLGTMDAQGFVRVAGRLRDMIIRGGENIYPREIEDVLHSHESVSDVAVVGLPDVEFGDIVAAFVRPSPGHEVDPDELVRHCRASLARFKVPTVWRAVEEFPQTASGKVQKFVLRDQISPR